MDVRRVEAQRRGDVVDRPCRDRFEVVSHELRQPRRGQAPLSEVLGLRPQQVADGALGDPRRAGGADRPDRLVHVADRKPVP